MGAFFLENYPERKMKTKNWIVSAMALSLPSAQAATASPFIPKLVGVGFHQRRQRRERGGGKTRRGRYLRRPH